ncbi:unnamed protein product, partial [Pleuronectes platessa]
FPQPNSRKSCCLNAKVHLSPREQTRKLHNRCKAGALHLCRPLPWSHPIRVGQPLKAPGVLELGERGTAGRAEAQRENASKQVRRKGRKRVDLTGAGQKGNTAQDS